MNIEIWLLFFSAYLMVTLSPGPNVLLVIKNAVKHGYKAAATTIIANLCCQLLLIISIAFGSGTLLANSPKLFFALKVIGGLYLIYLGLKGLCNKSTQGKVKIKDTEESASVTAFSYRKLGKEGFIVSASNPKTVIFLSAFLPQFLSTESSVTLQFMVMFLTIAFIVTMVHFVYSYIARNLSKKWASVKANAIFSKVTSCVFIVFGLAVLSSQRRVLYQ